MTKVVELYRHPVKSFTPERVDELSVVDNRVTGDRVLAFRFADQGAVDDWAWRRKINFVGLVNSPGIALLDLSFDDTTRTLSLKYEGEMFAEGSIDSEEDRFDLRDAIGEYVTSLEINPLVDHPERVPLNLIGDGKQGLFHDSKSGGVTLYSLESLNALEAHTKTQIDGRRFRANVVVDDLDAWAELSWTGRVTIGGNAYEVEKPVVRCLVTHANPVNGERDMDVMNSLTGANGMENPMFAVQLRSLDSAAAIRVGDSVVVG